MTKKQSEIKYCFVFYKYQICENIWASNSQLCLLNENSFVLAKEWVMRTKTAIKESSIHEVVL